MSTTYAVSATLAILSLGAFIVASIALLGEHARAVNAADLTALSAAAINATGDGDPCAAAGTFAQANGTTLESCVVAGDRVTVTVATSVRSATAAAETAVDAG